MSETVKDPLIELLAMNLHAHECIRNGRGDWPCWQTLTSHQRDAFRTIARGTMPLLTVVVPVR